MEEGCGEGGEDGIQTAGGVASVIHQYSFTNSNWVEENAQIIGE